MSTAPPYVSAISDDAIVVHCSDAASGVFLERFGFSVDGAVYTLATTDANARWAMLTRLRDNGFCFAVESENDPCLFLENLRKKKILEGPFKEISWLKNKKWKVKER